MPLLFSFEYDGSLLLYFEYAINEIPIKNSLNNIKKLYAVSISPLEIIS